MYTCQNRETSNKVLTSCAATEPFLAQSCHGYWSILSPYCQNSNNSHHLLSCLSRHLANVCQIDGFFFKLLCESTWVLYTRRWNVISFGKVICSLNFYSESRSCFRLLSTRHFIVGSLPPSPLFFVFLNNGLVLPRLPIIFPLVHLNIYIRHIVQETLLILMRNRYLWMPY